MAYKKKIKERQDVSTLIETLVPEFITADHPKMKLFIEKYYEFMESHQVYFEGIAFNEYKLVQEGIDDASIEPDYWIFEDEINNELMPDGNKNIHFDTRVLEGAVVNHRIQLETERDTTKDDELSFIIGETVYGNTTDAEAVVTGINGKNTAYLKPTTNTNFTYGEELTGVDSRAWTTFANGVLAGVFPDGSVEGFRTRGPIAATKELSEFADIDRTIEGLIDSSWKPEFYSHVPKQAATDRRMLLKQMKEVYRSKGGEASYDWLFRAIFASQEVDYYYPKDDMIRLSDGKWTKDKTVKILTDTANNIGIFEGREIRGHSSNATAIVEKTITKMVGPVQVTELYLSKITKGVGRDGTLGYFTKHERVESAPNANNETGLGDCTGIIEEVTIEYGGSNYVVGDVVQFIGGGGADARAEVVDTVDDILYGFRIVDSGDGYFVGDKLDFIDGGTGGEGAAATVGTIIATGKAQKNDNAVQGIKTETVSSNNINKALFSNSSFRFTAGIKENSGAVFDVSGPFFTSQFFQVGDLIRRQATLESTRVFTETGIGITLTQSGTTITLSGPITVDETKLIIGGKLTYANGNNNIIAGQGNTTTLYTRDAHTIGSGQDFNIYYADQTPGAPSATVVGANNDLVLYTLNSMHIDELGKKTITNFSNNDTVILYDTSRNVLWGSLNSNGSDAALTHTGFTFDIGNTPGNVEGIQVVIGDAFAVGGGYVQNQVNTTFNVAPVLTYTEHEFGAIETLAITNGGTGYKRLPIITVANNFMIGLSNSLEHTGDMNALLNVNLHSYSTGTVTQVGQVLTLSGGTFPDANSNPLHITYANGFEDYVTSVISATSLNMETSTGVPSPETYTLTYGANANNFAANEIIYTDDYESRGIVLDWFDEPGKQTYPRSVGTANEGTYVEKPGQTGYMRRNIVNGNTTLRVDMLTISDFTGVYSYFLEEGSPTASGFNDKLVFEDGSRIYPEDSITFMLMEDDFIILNEDGDRTFGEDVGSDRITAYDGANSIIYSTGTITQSGNVVTGISGETIFPNELIRGTLTYANQQTTTITGYTNATSITVEDSHTIGSAELYSIVYNPAATYGDNSSVSAVATGTGFRTVIVTEELHTKTKDNKIKIEGSADKIFNGIFSASPIDSNSYSYTIPEDFTAAQISGNLSSKFVKTAYLDTSNASLMDTSLKGNNAVVEVSSIAAGSIKSVAINDVGAGYSSNPKVLAGDGDNNAQMTAVIGAFAQYPGKYYGTQGRLDDAPKIQDSRYYQSFSYVVKAPIDTTKYRAHVDRLVHPAGMKMFGELAIILKASAELFSSGYHAGTPGLEGPGKPKDVDNYDDSGYEFGRPDYLHLHTPRFHPIILTRQILVNAEIKTDYQPHVEIYTHDVPHHAMDGRIEHRGNVEIKREDFRDVQNMIRSSASMLTYVMDESQGNGEQYEIGETVYQGTSYFTRIREATVAGYNHDSKTLNLINMIPNMDFILDKNIIGYLGGANYGILIEATLPMADITELEHSHETGDIIQITRATTDYFNGEYVIQTVPDTNTYTVFLGRGDPGEGVEAVAQTAYGGSWLKVETKSIANVWRVSSQNYESPFEGTITQEDELIDGVIYNYSITLEEGDTYLLPKIQFPEYDSGTVSIDMSFSSDLLLEEHINPDTGLHEDGYVLHEAHGGQVGMGPTRYISLEDDTEGIEWSYERGHLGHEPLSIPYMETQVTFDVYENAGYSLFLEDGSHLIEEGDETSRPLSRFITEDRHPGLHSTEAEHVLRPVGEIEFVFDLAHPPFGAPATEALTPPSILGALEGWIQYEDNSDLGLEDGGNLTLDTDKLPSEGSLDEIQFDLYDSVNQNLMLEDEGTYFIEEGDETASPLARFIILDNHPGLLATEYEHGKRPVGEVEFNLYENAGYSLFLEDGSHFIEEGDEASKLSRFILEGKEPGSHSTEAEHVLRPFGDIEYAFDIKTPISTYPTPLVMEDGEEIVTEGGETFLLTGWGSSIDEIQFDLYESLYWLYTLEDGSHLIEEGDESTELSRFVMERGPDMWNAYPRPDVQIDAEVQLGWNFMLEDEHGRIRNEGLEWGTEKGSLLRTEAAYANRQEEDNYASVQNVIFELAPIEGMAATFKEEMGEIETNLVVDRTFFNWHFMTEEGGDHLIFEDTDPDINWGLGTKWKVDDYPRAFYRGSDLLMIDKSGITADNPMRNYKLREARGQVIEVWGERIIGNQNFGCQVGRARGARQKYLDGVNHTGDPLQRGSLGKFGEDRQLDGDAYRQNYGEAGSIISGPGLNMNHPGRIGKFNQYWELMSIHHPIMLTGPAWWNDDIKTPVTIYPTPLVMEDGEEILTEGGETFLLTGWGSSIHVVATHYSPNANTALQGIYVAQDTNRLLPPRNSTISAVHLQLESATSAEGHYFELEEFPGRINLNYNDISMKSAHSAFTTFNGMTGQIEMVGGSTTITGTNTLFTSQLVTNDLIQTHAESVIVEDDEGIVMESNERIEHEDVTLAGLIEYSDDATLGQLDNIQLSEIRWFIATEDTQGHYGNYHVGTGWDQETKTDVPGSYYLVGESSIAEEEIELEINTPNPGGVGNRVVASETVWYQENLIWEDGTRILLTQAAEYRIKTITDDTTLNVHRASLDGTDIVPFWKMATETETTAIVSGLHSQ